MNKIVVISSAIVFSSLLVGCNATSIRSSVGVLDQVVNPVETATSSVVGSASNEAIASTAPVTYKNENRNFSFTIPTGWKKIAGDPNSERAGYMSVPTKGSCAFSFHYTRMLPSFPAESAVRTNVKTSKEEITIDKLIAAKRRDLHGKENGKKVRFTKGWETTQKGRPGKHQSIHYQAYDRENYYYNFSASSYTKDFEKCLGDLRQIIDSIKFGD